MKFEEGQQVKIIGKGQAPRLPGMPILLGHTGIIKEAIEEEGYWVEVPDCTNGYDWFWEESLEAIVHNGMTQSDVVAQNEINARFYS